MLTNLENNFALIPFLSTLTQVNTDTQQTAVAVLQDLECPDFEVHHFCMLLLKQLTPDEAAELTSHLPECQPCQNVYKETERHLTGQGCLSRAPCASS